MRTKLVYSMLIAIVSSILFVACDSGNSGDGATGAVPDGEAMSAVTDRQVDFAVKAVDSSLSSVPDNVLNPLYKSGMLASGDRRGADLPIDAELPEGGAIYEGEGITITFEGISTDPPGLILGFAFDDFFPIEGGEESISGEFTLLAGVDMGPESRILMVLNTEEGYPLTVTGGQLDGMTIGFDDFSVFFSLNESAMDPVGIEGTLLINGTPVDPGMLEGAIPALPVSEDAMKLAAETLIASLSQGELPDFLADVPFETISGGIENGDGDNLSDLLPFEGLPGGGVIYQGEGITVSFDGFSMDPPGLKIRFDLDGFAPIEGSELSVTGTFRMMACLEMGLTDQRVRLVFNTEEGAPLVVSGGQLDGTTIGFEDLSFFFSLSTLSLNPVGVEGTLLINGTPVDLDVFGGLLGGLL